MKPTSWALAGILVASVGCAAGTNVGGASGGGPDGAGGDVLTSNGPAGGSLPNANTTSASGGSGASGGNGAAGSGGTSSGGSGASGSNNSSAMSSSATASSSKAAGGGGKFCDTLSITASNQVCSDCLEMYCCKPIHSCIDANLLECIECLDCFLEGKGAACCNETIGKNAFIEECVDFNCSKECN